MVNSIERAAKEICMDHFSKIMEELEALVDTDEVTLTIKIQHRDFDCEACG